MNLSWIVDGSARLSSRSAVEAEAMMASAHWQSATLLITVFSVLGKTVVIFYTQERDDGICAQYVEGPDDGCGEVAQPLTTLDLGAYRALLAHLPAKSSLLPVHDPAK